jgi:prepilin-type N-terminal cleavage/methylation domain-containing protein
MKSDFKTKLIQHMLNKKNGEKGFTLIELLVVIIIIGILAAIALPSFLNQANKARQSEAKSYTGSMNRAQQAYYLEKNRFTTDISLLGLGIKTQTENYNYTIATPTAGAVNGLGTPLINALKGYVGTTWVGTTADGGEATTLAILCESTVATASVIAITSGSGVACGASSATCGAGMDEIK